MSWESWLLVIKAFNVLCRSSLKLQGTVDGRRSNAALRSALGVKRVVDGLSCEVRRSALKPSGRLAKVCHLLPKKRVGAQCLVVFPHSD